MTPLLCSKAITSIRMVISLDASRYSLPQRAAGNQHGVVPSPLGGGRLLVEFLASFPESITVFLARDL